MSERETILNALLDRYENSRHLLEPGASNRRVMLQPTKKKKDLPEYDVEYAPVRDAFNAAARELEAQNLVQIEWDSTRMVMITIALELEQVTQSYALVRRVHPRVRAEQIIRQTEDMLREVSSPWIAAWRDEVLKNAREALKAPPFYRDGGTQLADLLRAFRSYDALTDSITMRAFSIAAYCDSKYFERNVRKTFLAAARKYCAELAALCEDTVFTEPEKLSERDQLAFLGIYARPELYELSGSFVLYTEKGAIDFRAAMPYGLALPGTLVNAVTKAELDAIRTITFIENTTNYDEYLLSEQQPDELVFYHGGFLSPQKKKLVKLLCRAAADTVCIRFWADIDLGGFRMFEQLHAIVPQLEPMRMGAEEVERFHEHGLARSQAYLERLREAQKEGKHPLFADAVAAILHYGVTIEQEIFLSL